MPAPNVTRLIQFPRGIEEQARPIITALLADISGSMLQGGKIQALNEGLVQVRHDMMEDELLVDSVHFSIYGFNDTMHDIMHLEPIRTAKMPVLTAGSGTRLGAALRHLVVRMGERGQVPDRCYQPVIALLSDGLPTDEWREPLAELKCHPRLRQAVRVAVALGADADRKMLAEFVSPGHPVFEGKEAGRIKDFLKYVTWVSHTVARGQTADERQTLMLDDDRLEP